MLSNSTITRLRYRKCRADTTYHALHTGDVIFDQAGNVPGFTEIPSQTEGVRVFRTSNDKDFITLFVHPAALPQHDAPAADSNTPAEGPTYPAEGPTYHPCSQCGEEALISESEVDMARDGGMSIVCRSCLLYPDQPEARGWSYDESGAYALIGDWSCLQYDEDTGRECGRNARRLYDEQGYRAFACRYCCNNEEITSS